jgi:hypothetical protein
MKNFRFIIFIILLAFTLPYTYGGCVVIYSSGDFDSDNDQKDDETSAGFIGVTSQATITSMNAEALAVGGIAGGLTNSVSGSLKLNQNIETAQSDIFRPLRIPLLLGDSLRRIELGTALNTFGPANVFTESDILEGSCGGDFSYTLNLNRISGQFSGNLFFTDYCSNGIVISGETDVDGSFGGVISTEFLTAVFSFEDLFDESHILEGEISMDFSAMPILATLTAYSENERTGKIYWIKDYSINLSEFTGHIEIEIFGTFYHPDNGFVRLTTSEPFVVFDEDDWPAWGQLIIQGDNDTQTQLSAIDQLRYRIEADTDGDGIFDWNPGILKWPDM